MTGRGALLVWPATLAEELASEPGPVLLDVRWRLGGPPGLDSYREGHLPGAVFVDLGRDLAAPYLGGGPLCLRPLAMAGPDDAVLVGKHRDLHPVTQIQLGQHVGHVTLDRGLAEVELARDLGV